MKKMYKYILIITLMMFGFVGEVRAVETGTNECVEKQECFLLCSYNDGASDFNIYYDFGNRDLEFSIGAKGTIKINENETGTPGADAFMDDETKENLKNGVCPSNVYIDDDKESVCFDGNGTYCKNTEKIKKWGFDLTATSEANLKVNNASKKDASITYNSCAKDKSCQIACSYEHGYGDFAHIYIGQNNSLMTSFTWSGDVKKTYPLGTDSGNNKAFVSPGDIIPKLRERVCPQKVYMDMWGQKEICFDFNDSNYCTSNTTTNGHFDESEKLNDVKITTHISKEQFQDLLVEKMSCKTALEEIKKATSYDKIHDICGYDAQLEDGRIINQAFIFNHDNKYEIFTYSADENGKYVFKKPDALNELEYELSCSGIQKFYLNEVTYYEYSTDPITGAQTQYVSGYSNYFSKNKGRNGATQTTISTEFGGFCAEFDEKEGGGEPIIVDDCNDLLGDALISEINSYLLYIKVAVPIIIIVMGSIDFGTAFIASDEDKMKKAQKKFIMRLIIGMVIFFIPTLIDFLLTTANDIWKIFGGTCDVGF